MVKNQVWFSEFLFFFFFQYNEVQEEKSKVDIFVRADHKENRIVGLKNSKKKEREKEDIEERGIMVNDIITLLCFIKDVCNISLDCGESQGIMDGAHFMRVNHVTKRKKWRTKRYINTCILCIRSICKKSIDKSISYN